MVTILVSNNLQQRKDELPDICEGHSLDQLWAFFGGCFNCLWNGALNSLGAIVVTIPALSYGLGSVSLHGYKKNLFPKLFLRGRCEQTVKNYLSQKLFFANANWLRWKQWMDATLRNLCSIEFYPALLPFKIAVKKPRWEDFLVPCLMGLSVTRKTGGLKYSR